MFNNGIVACVLKITVFVLRILGYYISLVLNKLWFRPLREPNFTF